MRNPAYYVFNSIQFQLLSISSYFMLTTVNDLISALEVHYIFSLFIRESTIQFALQITKCLD
jgi:hypothetical protein